MKKFLTILSLLVLFTLFSVLADDSEDTQRFEVAQAHVAYQAAKVSVGMDTTISYIQELGGDTTELVTIQGEYETLSAQIQTFTSISGLRAGNEQLRDKIKEFREAATTLVEDNGGDVLTLRAQIDAAVEADADVQAAKEAFSSTAQSYTTDRFDRHYERLQAIYDRISAQYGESNPDEVANLQSILDSIASYGDTLESAAATGDMDIIKETYESIHELNQEFIQAVQDLSAGTGTGRPMGEARAEGQSMRAEKILEDMQTAISELTSLGYETSSLQTLYETAQSDYTAEQSSGDYTTFQADVQAYIDATKELVGASSPRIKKLEFSAGSLAEQIASGEIEAEGSA
ncbi:hypothetical protein EXS74_01635 [Candidatus Woesearchaeota archaeon]|nr:hypothetical protein [Candidatus Woesearchaeota archaeon]